MSETIKIICANLRYSGAKDGANSWAARKDLCMKVLQSRQPDLLCFQEMWHEQGLDIQAGFTFHEFQGSRYISPIGKID
jgi:hypothetical protein